VTGLVSAWEFAGICLGVFCSLECGAIVVPISDQMNGRVLQDIERLPSSLLVIDQTFCARPADSP